MDNIKINRDSDFIEGQVLLFDKPLYWTSFDLVGKTRNLIRNYLGIKKIKVGHAGTLDPLASGLMIICTGRATKKINLIQNDDKEYYARICLGATTPSYDLETEIIDRKDVSGLSEDKILKTLEEFKGEQYQVPPVYSAKNVGGKRAYEYARQGVEMKLEPRKVFFHEIEFIQYHKPELDVRIKCSKGTYIRSFANDIGARLGCGGYLSQLKRTKIGKYSIEDAMDINKFEDLLKSLKQF